MVCRCCASSGKHAHDLVARSAANERSSVGVASASGGAMAADDADENEGRGKAEDADEEVEEAEEAATAPEAVASASTDVMTDGDPAELSASLMWRIEMPRQAWPQLRSNSEAAL